MNCGGRINKGAGTTIVIPFDTTDIESVSVSFYTDGKEKIDAEDVVIEEGQVVATLSKTDLDLLGDGVLRYTMDYIEDGEEYSVSSNTNFYLKTPMSYSATSLTEALEEAREEGYASGYTQGQADCSGSSCNLQVGELNIGSDWIGSEIVSPSQGYDGFNSFEVSDMGYGQAKYDEGYAQGQADCPECSGGSCTLQDDYEVYLNGTETAGQFPIAPDEGYDGIANGTFYYEEAYQAKFNEGFEEGCKALHLWDEYSFADTDFRLSANTTYIFDMWIEWANEDNDGHEFRLFSNIDIEHDDREHIDIYLNSGAYGVYAITMEYVDYNGVHTLSVRLYSRQVHFELSTDENMNLTMTAISGGKVSSVSGATDFRNGAGSTFLINAVRDVDRDTPPYVWINDETNISFDKISILDNSEADNIKYVYKYKDGGFVDILGIGDDITFMEQYYDQDDESWETRWVEMEGCRIPCGI